MQTHVELKIEHYLRIAILLFECLMSLHLVFNSIASNGSIILCLTTYMKYGASSMFLLNMLLGFYFARSYCCTKC